MTLKKDSVRQLAQRVYKGVFSLTAQDRALINRTGLDLNAITVSILGDKLKQIEDLANGRLTSGSEDDDRKWLWSQLDEVRGIKEGLAAGIVAVLEGD